MEKFSKINVIVKQKISKSSEKIKSSGNFQKVKGFAKQKINSMKSDFNEGGIKRLALNKTFIIMFIVLTLFLIVLFYTDDNGKTTSTFVVKKSSTMVQPLINEINNYKAKIKEKENEIDNCKTIIKEEENKKLIQKRDKSQATLSIYQSQKENLAKKCNYYKLYYILFPKNTRGDFDDFNNFSDYADEFLYTYSIKHGVNIIFNKRTLDYINKDFENKQYDYKKVIGKYTNLGIKRFNKIRKTQRYTKLGHSVTKFAERHNIDNDEKLKKFVSDFLNEYYKLFKNDHKSWIKYNKINVKVRELNTKIKNFKKALQDNSYKIRRYKKTISEWEQKIAGYKKNIKILKHKVAIKTGQMKPANVYDYSILLDASPNKSYTTNPPIDGPTIEEYFKWSGTLVKRNGDLYIVWNATYNPFKSAFRDLTLALGGKGEVIDTAGFAFKNIEMKFSELQADKRVTVVGKYVSNIELKLVDGSSKTIPVLSNCYVERQ